MNRQNLRSRTPGALCACALLGAALLLSGCDDVASDLGYTDDDSVSQVDPGTVDAGPRDTDGAGSLSRSEFCGFLEDEPSKLDGLGTVTARRTLVEDISDLYESQTSSDAARTINDIDGVRLDRLAKSCPMDAAEVLMKARILSFAQL